MTRPMEPHRQRGPTAIELIRAWEDMQVLDLLDRLSLCQECYGMSPGGLVFGCSSCAKWLTWEVMET